ncbi:unnamed protein product [Rotaria sp. Silwood2]|nr:unnamed protein product [Rotaria sp. Silwood2]CAF3140045.1 unnamed protein product [Rotaria sp. Silwood2]CAF4048572.1 unnamed protein product [Rotaria sp. Silwood2]CAF4162059.1 unnamed protein product [Rotaria sp. Silwood2]
MSIASIFLGILGILTGILMCYLGVHAGHVFVRSTCVRRMCTNWLVSGIICGSIGLVLSKGGHSNGWIPINTNLWSLSFIFVVAGLAFLILTILYLLVDVKQWFNGAPFLWLGMNSIVIYVGHMFLEGSFPVQFEVDETHVKLMAVNMYGAFFWTLVAALMFHKKIFIAI